MNVSKDKTTSTTSLSQQPNNSSSSGKNWLTLCLVLVSHVTICSTWVLIVRYSRIKDKDSSAPKYLPTTVVLFSECVKSLSWLVALLAQHSWSVSNAAGTFSKEILGRPREGAKILVPACLYVVQNNLLFVALSNLEAATYQVTYELKILTTAGFSALMLQRRLTSKQWAALLLLFFGVSLVQLANVDKVSDAIATRVELGTTSPGSQIVSPAPQQQQQPNYQGSRLLGLLSVLSACVLSGFSGVYYEKLVKTGAQPSVVIRNIQLAFPSVLFAMVAVIQQDYSKIQQGGSIFQGYSFTVFIIICLQAYSGMIVAVLIKYADNIIKGFTSATSIIVSSVGSWILLKDLAPSALFMLGAGMVVVSVVLYSNGQKQQQQQQQQQQQIRESKSTKISV